MTDETVVDVLDVAEKVLVEVSERVKVSKSIPARSGKNVNSFRPTRGQKRYLVFAGCPRRRGGVVVVWNLIQEADDLCARIDHMV